MMVDLLTPVLSDEPLPLLSEPEEADDDDEESADDNVWVTVTTSPLGSVDVPTVTDGEGFV